MKTYQRIATLLGAIANCKTASNTVWQDRHEAALERLLKSLPTGSGINNGIHLDPLSTGEKLILHADFQHMSEHGFYTGWTQHKVIVTPSLVSGLNIKITGRDKNNIKEYLGDLFYTELNEEEPADRGLDDTLSNAFASTHAAAQPAA